MNAAAPIAVTGVRRAMREMADGSIRVQVEIDPASRDTFLQHFGEIDMPVALARLNLRTPATPETQREEPAPTGHLYGHHAAALIKGGFFSPSNTKVLEAIGSDKEYQEWCRHQPSAIDGNGDLDERAGELRCEPAHVRRAGEAGTGYKPPYATIPLTHAQHALQHSAGEMTCLVEFTGNKELTYNSSQEWFDKQRTKHVLAWAKARLAAGFRVESIGDIAPVDLLAWATKRNLQHFLPSVYR